MSSVSGTHSPSSLFISETRHVAPLSFSQKVILGIVVILCLSAATGGLVLLAGPGGLLGGRYEITILVNDAIDVEPGTPVHVRGVEAGKVVSLEYADEGNIRLRVRLDPKFRGKLYADATARVSSHGLLGNSFIALQPGSA